MLRINEIVERATPLRRAGVLVIAAAVAAGSFAGVAAAQVAPRDDDARFGVPGGRS